MTWARRRPLVAALLAGIVRITLLGFSRDAGFEVCVAGVQRELDSDGQILHLPAATGATAR